MFFRSTIPTVCTQFGAEFPCDTRDLRLAVTCKFVGQKNPDEYNWDTLT